MKPEMLLKLLTVLCMPLLVACATPLENRSEYPRSLPTPNRSTGECPTFSGVFRNAGAEIRHDGSLSAALLTRDVLDLGSTFESDDELRLSVDTKVVPALGIPGTGKLTVARLRIDSKSGRSWEDLGWENGLCTGGTLVVHLNPQQSGVGGAPGVVASHGEGVHLLSGQDGSLIAMRQVVNAGVAIIVPWYSRKFNYYHFHSATSAGKY